MSIANPRPNSQPAPSPQGGHPSPALASIAAQAMPAKLAEILDKVRQRVAPVWPLEDYVAVNPFLGLTGLHFLDASLALRGISDLQTLMPVEFYRTYYRQGLLTRRSIIAAIDEMVADRIPGAELLDVNMVESQLTANDDRLPDNQDSARWLYTYAEYLDRSSGTQWHATIVEEIGKHCALYYDQGQALWRSAWQNLPLYHAWRQVAAHDRAVEIAGLRQFRRLVQRLPEDPTVAIGWLLGQLEIPARLWEPYLWCLALSMPGWCAWSNYQHLQASRRGRDNQDFFGLLAMRLAYEWALARQSNFRVNWDSISSHHGSSREQRTSQTKEQLVRYCLLRASEIDFRDSTLIQTVNVRLASSSSNPKVRPAAQWVFCIDVRSERIRRQLEAVSPQVQTLGSAGFFGAAFEYLPLAEQQGRPQVPALIAPRFQVRECLAGVEERDRRQAVVQRLRVRHWRKASKYFQSSAVTCFSFVEMLGLFDGIRLLSRTWGRPLNQHWHKDGLPRSLQRRLGPDVQPGSQCSLTEPQSIELAESILRGAGLTEPLGRLVVFCGHTSQTVNNPLQAGLDCGACGGHSGEANARFAARLLNQPFVRQALAQRGLAIPADSHFLAAIHNTTTDEVQFFDQHELPESHLPDYQALVAITDQASINTRLERLNQLAARVTTDPLRRSRDWSEVRPEWGLAGNAAFIVGPRQLSAALRLDGRVFLHSYDHHRDADNRLLEQILTAPVIVASWINLQYYGTTVAPRHFGSGTKTVHNVVGQFGILSGNGGDLMTGLPWQSIHDGRQYQHQPLRLLVVVAASRQAIESILLKHRELDNLIGNGWVQLLAADESGFHRYTAGKVWEPLMIAAGA